MRGFSVAGDLTRIGEGDAPDLTAVRAAASHLRFGEMAHLLSDLLRAGIKGGRRVENQLRILLANCHKIVGLWDQAENDYRKVISATEAESTPYERARACIGVAEIKSFRGDFEYALELLERGASIARQSEQRGLEALCQIQQAGIHSRTGDQQKARQLVTSAQRMVGAMPREEALYVDATANLTLGLFAFRDGHLSEAEECMNRSLGLLADDFPQEKGEALRYLGIVLGARGRHREALATLQKAMRLFQSMDFGYGLARTYNSIGRTFLSHTLLEEAIFYMEKGVRICRDLRAYAELATVYGKIGNAYMICEDYGRAITFLQKDLELSNRFKNYYALGYTHRNLGRCHVLGGNLDEAIGHLQESLALFQFVEDTSNTGRVYLDLAQAMAERGILPAAEEMANRAWHALPGAEAAYAQVVLGGVERRLGNLEASARHLSAGLAVLEGGAATSRLAEARYEHGLLSIDRARKNDAMESLERALRICKELGLRKLASRCFAVVEQIGEVELLELLLRNLPEPAAALPVEAEGEVAPA